MKGGQRFRRALQVSLEVGGAPVGAARPPRLEQGRLVAHRRLAVGRQQLGCGDAGTREQPQGLRFLRRDVPGIPGTPDRVVVEPEEQHLPAAVAVSDRDAALPGGGGRERFDRDHLRAGAGRALDPRPDDRGEGVQVTPDRRGRTGSAGRPLAGDLPIVGSHGASLSKSGGSGRLSFGRTFTETFSEEEAP